VDALREIIASIPDDAWGLAAFGAIAPFIIALFPLLRIRWHEWRLQRRVDEDRPLAREEQRELALKIGGEAEPFDLLQTLTASTVLPLLIIAEAAARETGSDFTVSSALLVLTLAGLLFRHWRKINDPPELIEQDDEKFYPTYELPREAVAGIGFGVLLTLGIVAYAYSIAS